MCPYYIIFYLNNSLVFLWPPWNPILKLPWKLRIIAIQPLKCGKGLPLVWFWKIKFLKYFKLVEFAIVVVLGNVENECTFSTIIFMKSKLRNHLTTNLDLVVSMYVQCVFILQTFPFHIANTQKQISMGWNYKILEQFTWHFHESYLMHSNKFISPKSMNFPFQ